MPCTEIAVEFPHCKEKQIQRTSEQMISFVYSAIDGSAFFSTLRATRNNYRPSTNTVARNEKVLPLKKNKKRFKKTRALVRGVRVPSRSSVD